MEKKVRTLLKVKAQNIAELIAAFEECRSMQKDSEMDYEKTVRLVAITDEQGNTRHTILVY